MRLDCHTLSPSDAYRLLTLAVTPRPIALVSTLSPDGAPNLAPFSFFMAGGAHPPSVALSPVTPRDRPEKDTLANIRATGAYTISVVTDALVEAANRASAAWPSGTSEWESARLVPAASTHVAPPWVAASPIAMECRLFRIVPHGDGPLAANYVIGEVLAFHVDDGLLGAPHPGTVGRLAGDAYARLTDTFTLARPDDPR